MESTKIRVVVADDDQDILEPVVYKLNQAGFETIACPDGVSALQAIEADLPRLAILDSDVDTGFATVPATTSSSPSALAS